jgi:hypothetical protein
MFSSYLEFQTMDEVHKPSDSDYYIPYILYTKNLLDSKYYSVRNSENKQISKCMR